jgi:hypothetical protein
VEILPKRSYARTHRFTRIFWKATRVWNDKAFDFAQSLSDIAVGIEVLPKELCGMKHPQFVPAPKFAPYSADELIGHAQQFYEAMQRRRTIRDFSPRPVSREVIKYCLGAAGTAPSGANLQPWHFVAVSDPGVKQNPHRGRRGEKRVLRASGAQSLA